MKTVAMREPERGKSENCGSLCKEFTFDEIFDYLSKASTLENPIKFISLESKSEASN